MLLIYLHLWLPTRNQDRYNLILLVFNYSTFRIDTDRIQNLFPPDMKSIVVYCLWKFNRRARGTEAGK